MAIREAVLAGPPGPRCRSKLARESLAFAPGDVTAGSEDELQAVVVGNATACDLPITIHESRFLKNIANRSSSGVASKSAHLELQQFLEDHGQVWENSWVRFPTRRLSPHALNTFLADLKIGERGQSRRHRTDSVKFTFEQAGETWLRVPISYALKLALADVAGTQPHMPEKMQAEAKRLLRCFSNDNTSPETTSFHVVTQDDSALIGEKVSRESARRFLFTSLLMSWANLRFGLLESGQRALVYHAPHPPVRQAELSAP